MTIKLKTKAELVSIPNIYYDVGLDYFQLGSIYITKGMLNTLTYINLTETQKQDLKNKGYFRHMGFYFYPWMYNVIQDKKTYANFEWK